MQLTWQQIGSPSQVGTNQSPIGEILQVTQEDIDWAARRGGNPVVTLSKTTSGSSPVEQWVILRRDEEA